jgi:serine/threonine protein kinase/tetratricopeptide (TPR) repeat protein
MEVPIASPAEQFGCCDLCGTPLALSAGAPGCLNCLLAGGRDGAEERRYQHYEVTMREDGVTPSELGRGAMGITYRALDLNLGAPVALKVISARYSNQPAARDRFRREAQAAAQLRHPNVASVYHFGETAAGQCFYAMELVEGETLESRVRREGPLGAEIVLGIAIQVAHALLAAEKHGLVHRDLKPSNLMLVPDDSGNERTPGVKVIDFGLAKAVTDTREAAEPNQTGFAGTPGFASPEQSQSTGWKLDIRSDIYSLGATLWYALTEEIPAPGNDRPVERLSARKPALLTRLLRRVLATDPAGRPQSARALLAELKLCQAKMEAAPRRRQSLPRVLLLLGLFAIGGTGLTGYLLRRHHAAIPMAPEKSIAVLPLENLSEDEKNAFFADGIQGDLLTSLTKISDLKVISRTSVMQYRGTGAERNLREIAHALGVAHVLEGGVRRIDNRVVVNVQLIDARTDQPIWAERYDRTIADSIGLQGELATEIALALKAKLAPQEKASLGMKPTSNPEAYVTYLRALDYEENFEPASLHEYHATLDRLYAKAIALDPKFALAYARASISFSNQFFQTHDPALKAKARSQAEEALRLEPRLGEAHLASGLYSYLVEGDYDAALEQFTMALTALPNNVEVLQSIARIYRKQGRWREAIAGFAQARNLNPNADPFELVRTLWSVRDWPGTAVAIKRNLQRQPPGVPFAKMGLSQMEVVANGDLPAARAWLQKIPASVDPDGGVTLANWNLSMLERNWAAAEKWLDDFPSDEFPDDGPKSYYQGQTALARGDVELAQTLFEKSRPALEKNVRDHPGAAGEHAALGILFAYMGRKEEAIRESRRAVELCPENTDAFNGAQFDYKLALVYALIGENDQAIPRIERLLRTPGASTRTSFWDGGITQAELRLRWQWDKLRGDPRFWKMLDGPEPKTIY